MSTPVPHRQIRAMYDGETITVYQAYKDTIADAAIASQKLNSSPDFKPGRMTWIKPSWSWMMYRAGYSFKDPGQARILALKMRRDDFISLLEQGVLTSHVPAARQDQQQRKGERERSIDVKIQWDPERSPKLEVLPYRSIQIGIPGALSTRWADTMIAAIEDVTDKARKLKKVIDEQPEITVQELIDLGLMPDEKPFPVPEAILSRLEMTSPDLAPSKVPPTL